MLNFLFQKSETRSAILWIWILRKSGKIPRNSTKNLLRLASFNENPAESHIKGTEDLFFLLFFFGGARRVERCTPKRPSTVKCLAVKRSAQKTSTAKKSQTSEIILLWTCKNPRRPSKSAKLLSPSGLFWDADSIDLFEARSRLYQKPNFAKKYGLFRFSPKRYLSGWVNVYRV